MMPTGIKQPFENFRYLQVLVAATCVESGSQASAYMLDFKILCDRQFLQICLNTA